jgi:hypothetical protein
MPMRGSLIASSLALLALAGCASLDKDECRMADWRAIGLEDGVKGRALDRLGDHRKACAKHGVTPDTDRYIAGRTEGLATYCTPDNGYRVGRTGESYRGVCPELATPGFVAAYNRGHELYALHARLSGVERELNTTRESLKDGTRNPRERAGQVDRLESLSREAQQLDAEIARLERR